MVLSTFCFGSSKQHEIAMQLTRFMIASNFTGFYRLQFLLVEIPELKKLRKLCAVG